MKQKSGSDSTFSLKQKGRWVYIDPKPSGSVLEKIKHELSYIKKGSNFMPNPQWGVVKLYQEGRGRFPIGCVDRVLKILKQNNCTWYLRTLPRLVKSLDIKDNGLRPYQIEAVKSLYMNRGGIISVPTGGGKTRIALAFVQAMNIPTLVIVPTIDLKVQWEERCGKNVYVRTYQSLKSKTFIQQFKLVVFDECHMVAAETLQLVGLNLSEDAVTVGLSATPFMRDDDNLKVEGVLGQIVYDIDIRQLIDNGYLVDAEINYWPLKKYENPFADYQMMYREYIVENGERNGLIKNIISKCDGYTLILVDHIDHGNTLLEMLDGYNVRFINGKSKNREDNDYDILIATSIYDQGVDIPRLKNLVLAGGGKSAIRSTQRIGRVLRKYDGKDRAIIHDFKDNAKWLNKHYKERRDIFEKNFTVHDK